MATDHSAAPRSWATTVTTAILLVAHLPLALYTILVSAGLASQEQESAGRCRVHGLNCGDHSITAAAWIVGGVTLALVLLDYGRLARRGINRRRPWVVPLLCCVIQIGLLAALAAVNS